MSELLHLIEYILVQSELPADFCCLFIVSGNNVRNAMPWFLTS